MISLPSCCIGLLVVSYGDVAAAAAAVSAPNIITILTDDQGFGDSSYNCENSTGMCAQTPNLDALALGDSSALFSRFYSAAGVCSPTRAAYLTGRTNERSCITSALRCDQEDPAPGCSMGKGLPCRWAFRSFFKFFFFFVFLSCLKQTALHADSPCHTATPLIYCCAERKSKISRSGSVGGQP
jgi:hypothetical protein